MSQEIETLLYPFKFTHLPEDLRKVAEPFYDLACSMAQKSWPDPCGLKEGLRKLLGARNRFIEAALS